MNLMIQTAPNLETSPRKRRAPRVDATSIDPQPPGEILRVVTCTAELRSARQRMAALGIADQTDAQRDVGRSLVDPTSQHVVTLEGGSDHARRPGVRTIAMLDQHRCQTRMHG